MRNRWLIVVAFIALVAVLATLISGLVQGALYPLVAEGLSLIRTLLLSLQSVIWIVLVFVGVNLALRSLRGGRRRQRQVVHEERDYPGRVSALTGWMRQVDSDSFYAWRVSRHLADLSREAFGHGHTLSEAELRESLADSYSETPADVAAYLRRGLALRDEEQSSTRLERQVRSLAARFRPNRATQFSAESDLLHTIEYLEAELEITHDNHPPSR